MAEPNSIRRTERSRLRSIERRRQAVSAQMVEDRYRAQSDALRRANILESGTPEERAAMRAEQRAEFEAGRQRVLAEIAERKLTKQRAELQARADRGDFLADLTLKTDLRIRWTSGEAPASVVWDPPLDRRLGPAVR